jgi:hypothetical protein
MKWEEIRKIYPNQYVLLEALEYHINGDKKYIDDMAVIKAFQDPKEATKTLVRCKGNNFVYHTANEEVIIEIVRNSIYRGVI